MDAGNTVLVDLCGADPTIFLLSEPAMATPVREPKLNKFQFLSSSDIPMKTVRGVFQNLRGGSQKFRHFEQ